MMRISAIPGALWKAMGEPFPSLARWIRHRLLGNVWPARGGTTSAVAVVITCHNYGHFLESAIASVLAQTLRPQDILVIDDSSTDNTAKVALQYAENGIRIISGQWRSVEDARNVGAQNTDSEFLCFLDADDRLAPRYIEQCLRALRDPTVAIAYANMQKFGDQTDVFDAPAFDRTLLQRTNFISSHAVLRRQVFDLVGGYRKLKNAHEDWDLYRRMMQLPWKAVKVPTAVHYRIHSGSYLHCTKKNDAWCYPFAAAHCQQHITIFTPFAGRRQWFEIYSESVRNLHHDPTLVSLHWYDTSGDKEFGNMLRKTIAKMPFSQTTYTAAPHPPLWGHDAASLLKNRVGNTHNAQYYYELAVVRAYNHMLAHCNTEFVLTIEDDVIPEPDTLERLFAAMDEDVVAVVAPYRCPRNGHFLVWHMTPDGRPDFPYDPGTGIQQVAGSGFGCSLFRVSALKKFPIMTRVGEDPPRWYDHIAFEQLRKKGLVLCDLDARVRHLSAEYAATLQSAVSHAAAENFCSAVSNVSSRLRSVTTP